MSEFSSSCQCDGLGFHVSFRSGCDRNVIDFTERKLRIIHEKMRNRRDHNKMVSLMSSYVNGHIKMAWSNGNPVWMAVDNRASQSNSVISSFLNK